jgi:hypothetical protein
VASSSENFTQSFFDQAFSDEPGTKFLYDSGASHLLNHILVKATGKSSIDIIRENLFEPLNITDYSWDILYEGVNAGGWGLHLNAYSLAKLGYTALNNGDYFGEQIVSSDWINEATKTQIDNNRAGYGYQWWKNSFGGYRASGLCGQCIIVMPEYNMVVVITAGTNSDDKYNGLYLAENYIVPSIKSNKALPENAEAYNALYDIIMELDNPIAQETMDLPERAFDISNKTYVMDSLYSELTLIFDKQDQCILKISQNGNTYELSVGLDGVFRITDVTRVGRLLWYPDYESVALKGHWQGENEFVLSWHYVGEPYKEEYVFNFDENNLSLTIEEYTTSGMTGLAKSLTLKGVIKE